MRGEVAEIKEKIIAVDDAVKGIGYEQIVKDTELLIKGAEANRDAITKCQEQLLELKKSIDEIKDMINSLEQITNNGGNE